MNHVQDFFFFFSECKAPSLHHTDWY